MHPTTIPDERAAIASVLQHYIEGARSGSGEQMRAAFHQDATIFGYFDQELLAGPI